MQTKDTAPDNHKATHSLPLIFDSYDECQAYIDQTPGYSWGRPRLADMGANGAHRYGPLVQYAD